MEEYKVVFEIQVNAESPLEAARITLGWLRDKDSEWEFIVQENGEGETPIYLVDLEDNDAVLPLNYYQPLIS